MENLVSTKDCPRCGNVFSCCPENCWCNELPPIMPLNDYEECLCPACLKDAIQVKLNKSITSKTLTPIGKAEMIENEDYYINENGLWVLTSEYHLKRGYCCENGCKHCPYGQ